MTFDLIYRVKDHSFKAGTHIDKLAKIEHSCWFTSIAIDHEFSEVGIDYNDCIVDDVKFKSFTILTDHNEDNDIFFEELKNINHIELRETFPIDCEAGVYKIKCMLNDDFLEFSDVEEIIYWNF